MKAEHKIETGANLKRTILERADLRWANLNEANMITKLQTDKQLEAREFIPQKIGDKYITFLLELSKCYKCKQDMIVCPRYKAPFPFWNKVNFNAQVERANLVIKSNVLVDDHFICINCVKSGKADFLCALCEERKSTDKIKDWIGDPAEFLCWDCFNTVTAAIWQAKSADLHEKHKYDGD